MTKERLKSYIRIKGEVEQFERIIENIENTLYNAQRILVDGMPRSKAIRDNSGLIDKLVGLKKSYNVKWDELINLQVEIEDAIETLTPTLRTLMRAYYIEGKTFDRVATAMKYSPQRIRQLHGIALQKIRENGGRII